MSIVMNVPIPELIQAQRKFFSTGKTRDRDFRIQQLQSLERAIVANQDKIVAAVQSDLGRAAFEAYFEIATLSEIKLALKQLKKWMKPRRVTTSLDVFPASAWVQPEPLGVALIIGPWNYPFQLMMSPLVGAIAAGNCAVLKPSEYAPEMSKVVTELVRSTFDSDYIAVVEGDAQTSQELLAQKFDHIFFTGGTEIGRIVMQAAAKHLTPVTLELGGKSPCFVDASVRLDYAAKRIAWGKFINAGQTCIAPDYILVDAAVKDEFIVQLKKAVLELYGDNPAVSPDYARIVNQRQLDRLKALLSSGTIVIGGHVNDADRYLAPTVLDNVDWNDSVMESEIFGPILPILAYDNLDDAIALVNERPKPLALYIFSKSDNVQTTIVNTISSGGVCINDTVLQVSVGNLPFGGVGDSGTGSYHGKASFDTFSHDRSFLKRSILFDLDWRYAPYTDDRLKFLKKIVTGK
jgi:aldehyde dehydrogenase (NAD+)